jgi:hypothetical protein
MMADIRTWYEDAQWINYGDTVSYASTTSVTVATDLTARYTVNRRVRAVGSSTGTIYGTITASSYSAPNTTITAAWDSGGLVSESLTWSAGIVDPDSSAVAIEGLAGGTDLQTFLISVSGGGSYYEFGSSYITSGYDYIFIGRSLVPSADSSSFYAQMSSDGGTSYYSTNSYEEGGYYSKSGGTPNNGAHGDGEKDFLVIGSRPTESTAAQGGLCFEGTLFNPADATKHKFFKAAGVCEEDDGFVAAFWMSGKCKQTAAINAIKFYFSGTSIASGTIECWRRATQ